MTIFDIFKSFFNKKEISKEDIEKYLDIYMLNYLFSMHREYIYYANLLNKYQYNDKQAVYRFYKSIVNTDRIPYGDIKKMKKENEFDEKLMKLARLFFPYLSAEKIKENWVFIEDELEKIKELKK